MARTETQQAVIAALADPVLHGGTPVERVDTHASVLFIAGERVYKLKRAVRLAYLDYSDLDVRHLDCAREVELNRRTAPDLYLGTAPVLGWPDGHLTLGPLSPPSNGAGAGAKEPPIGGGVPLDWVVVMRRFPEADLLDRVAARGALSAETMRDLAEAIAAFHDEAEPRPDAGGMEDLRGIARVVVQELGRFARLFPAERTARFARLVEAALDRHGPLLDRRRDAGYVRHCHGDLHLRNIVLWDGRPTPFDCIEFDERYAVIDVLYDLAYLLMDLEHRRLRAHGNMLLNRYVELSGDLAGLALLPLFIGLRAGIRGHITANAAGRQQDPGARARMEAEAATYLDLALAALNPPPPALIAIGGLSGTGKTTLARWLAPEVGPMPGAVILRSDVLRKRLLGMDENMRLPAEGYSETVTARVYGEIAGRAGLALESRHAVICDAVYARSEQRAGIEAIARAAERPFTGLWLVADQETQVARVQERVNDASDATADLVRRQAAFDIGEMNWEIIPANGGPEEVAGIARRLIASSRRG